MNWNKVTLEDGAIDLVGAMKEGLGESYDKLPEEDKAMIEEILMEVESLHPISNLEAASVALVCARHLLLMGQLVGAMFGQLGIMYNEDGTMNDEPSRIKIVKPKGATSTS